mgnify:CR=1 FL=1
MVNSVIPNDCDFLDKNDILEEKNISIYKAALNFDPNKNSAGKIIKGFIYGVIILIVLIILLGSFGTVSTGERGLKTVERVVVERALLRCRLKPLADDARRPFARHGGLGAGFDLLKSFQRHGRNL